MAILVKRDEVSEGQILDAVMAECRGCLAKYEVPDEFLFWDEIPLTGTGKMDKKAVRASLKAQNYVLPSLRGGGKSKL